MVFGSGLRSTISSGSYVSHHDCHLSNSSYALGASLACLEREAKRHSTRSTGHSTRDEMHSTSNDTDSARCSITFSAFSSSAFFRLFSSSSVSFFFLFSSSSFCFFFLFASSSFFFFSFSLI